MPIAGRFSSILGKRTVQTCQRMRPLSCDDIGFDETTMWMLKLRPDHGFVGCFSKTLHGAGPDGGPVPVLGRAVICTTGLVACALPPLL